MASPKQAQPTWKTFIAGASAGLVVDTSLYPVDTIKARLQSEAGFIKSGGFSNLYRGLPPVLVGSIPNSAVFFLTYESIKSQLEWLKTSDKHPSLKILGDVFAASAGEVISCTLRVPCEVVKMKSQTRQETGLNNIKIARSILAKEGLIGLYRGFSSTVIRDLPFSAFQYPLWEFLKMKHIERNHKAVSVYESAWYGSIAGAIAAFATTPLDVARTRIILADPGDQLATGRVLAALRVVKNEKGVKGLFAGVVPRVLWISLGAAIFLGSYEEANKLLSQL